MSQRKSPARTWSRAALSVSISALAVLAVTGFGMAQDQTPPVAQPPAAMPTQPPALVPPTQPPVSVDPGAQAAQIMGGSEASPGNNQTVMQALMQLQLATELERRQTELLTETLKRLQLENDIAEQRRELACTQDPTQCPTEDGPPTARLGGPLVIDPDDARNQGYDPSDWLVSEDGEGVVVPEDLVSELSESGSATTGTGTFRPQTPTSAQIAQQQPAPPPIATGPIPPAPPPGPTGPSVGDALGQALANFLTAEPTPEPVVTVPQEEVVVAEIEPFAFPTPAPGPLVQNPTDLPPAPPPPPVAMPEERPLAPQILFVRGRRTLSATLVLEDGSKVVAFEGDTIGDGFRVARITPFGVAVVDSDGEAVNLAFGTGPRRQRMAAAGGPGGVPGGAGAAPFLPIGAQQFVQ